MTSRSRNTFNDLERGWDYCKSRIGVIGVEFELDGGAGEQHIASSRASKTAEVAPSEEAASGSFPVPAQAGKDAL